MECRQREGVWEILVKWFGLEDAENPWENAVGIYEDMLVAFKRICHKKGRTNPLLFVEQFLGHAL